ncbi:alpha/beta-hydrolase family protein [Streptomyces sp. R21]|uniref:Alpha/beta-hydrolase family protein n=1 Tax=Streptomyces sp. R21 TaxID=3238627 RepID=A0AB39P1W2_9ACTN
MRQGLGAPPCWPQPGRPACPFLGRDRDGDRLYCLSLTPSLLPRAWWLQGLTAGVTAAVGYAVGAVLEAATRALARRTGTHLARAGGGSCGPRSALSPPDWLDRPPAPDVSPAMRWYPLVTFWQVACDLAGLDGVPDGYGHRYGAMPTSAWARITRPPGWTGTDTGRLARTSRRSVASSYPSSPRPRPSPLRQDRRHHSEQWLNSRPPHIS